MARRIDGITISVGCGDILAWTLPTNRWAFDRLLIVTTKDDELTQRVCRHYHVETLITDAFYEQGNVFNKGRAIAKGLEHLAFTDWVVHFDADIVLPPRAWEFMRNLPLNEQCLFGCDRLMIPSYDAWVSFLSSPTQQHYDASVWPVPFPVGYRCFYHGGYTPIGYFQMFNRNSVHLIDPLYPTEHDTAADSDVAFALQWPRERRGLLPEFVVYHLDSEVAGPGDIGVNWAGRKTRQFGPQCALHT